MKHLMVGCNSLPLQFLMKIYVAFLTNTHTNVTDVNPPLLPQQPTQAAADSSGGDTLERKDAQERPLIVRLTRPDTPENS